MILIFEHRAAARTLQTYRDDLAAAALRLTADTQLEQLTARYDPLQTFGYPRQDGACLVGLTAALAGSTTLLAG